MPQSANSPISYTRWGDVPAHLLTRTALADLDLPRQPAGPVRATIDTRNAIGRKATFELYDVRESQPTSASAAQLAAAAARRTTTRTCQDCGAHPDAPLVPATGGHLLCHTCAHIARLRERQAAAAADARDVAATVARLLDDEHLAVLAVQYVPGEPTAHGTPRPPAAARITVLDRTGTTLFDETVRLTGPRTPGAPAHAVDHAEPITHLTDLLAERTVVIWSPADLDPLREALRRRKPTCALQLPNRVNSLKPAATRWRADLDPSTGFHRAPTPPTTADRTLLLLRRIAAAEVAQQPVEALLAAC
ncbi:hypothetical protein [Kitasatospora sp. NPDC004272]